MRFVGKVGKKYYDQILKGKKFMEYREISKMTLIDGKRKMTLKVKSVHSLSPEEAKIIQAKHPDVPWKGNRPMISIELGDEIKQ